MAQPDDLHRLASPRIYLVRMVIFIILAAFVVLILYKQILVAFRANPSLNGLIIAVLVIGVALALRQVARLFAEVRWANASHGGQAPGAPPVLLAPMAAMLRDAGPRPISTATLRAILDSIAARLDESRETARYLVGLLVFLGLLGTFWGLLETVGSIGGVIGSMQTGADATVMFDDLKNGLAKPIAGMSISFTSSLFGLAGSLILGFLDLQAGQAQNRFYNELEEALTARTEEQGFAASPGMPAELRAALDKIAGAVDAGGSRASASALANLAEGIQGLVQHMRGEQQMIRDWVEAQAGQQNEVKKLLERLAAETARPQ